MIIKDVPEDIMEKLARGAIGAILVEEVLEELEKEKRIYFHRATPDAPFQVTCLIEKIYGITIYSDGTAEFAPTSLMQGNRMCGKKFLSDLGIDLGYSGWQTFITLNFSLIFPKIHKKLQQWHGCVIKFK